MVLLRLSRSWRLVEMARLIIEYEGKLYEFATNQANSQLNACRLCVFAHTKSCSSHSLIDCHDANEFIKGDYYAWRLLE